MDALGLVLDDQAIGDGHAWLTLHFENGNSTSIGPVNAVVYVSLNSMKETLKTLDHFIENDSCIKKFVDIHIYYDENISEYESQQVYPANLLRNIGNNLARSRYVINLDVDFLPNPTMRDILK